MRWFTDPPLRSEVEPPSSPLVEVGALLVWYGLLRLGIDVALLVAGALKQLVFP